jgi:hypothetical protein
MGNEAQCRRPNTRARVACAFAEKRVGIFDLAQGILIADCVDDMAGSGAFQLSQYVTSAERSRASSAWAAARDADRKVSHALRKLFLNNAQGRLSMRND